MDLGDDLERALALRRGRRCWRSPSARRRRCGSTKSSRPRRTVSGPPTTARAERIVQDRRGHRGRAAPRNPRPAAAPGPAARSGCSAIDCCNDENRNRASSSVSAATHGDPEHDVRQRPAAPRAEALAIDRRSPRISTAGAKCEAKANGSPRYAASCAPNRLDPRIQIGTSSPAPGTACTACPGSAGRK